MDPNATLRAILASTDRYEATALCEALETWLSRGGYAPTVPADATYWPGTNTDYAVLSPWYDTDYKWLFIKYDADCNRVSWYELKTEK